MKSAFIFTGQGSQYLGMGYDLYTNSDYARNLIDNLDFGYDFKEICVKKNQLINDTLYSQSAIFIISIILANLLKREGIIPDKVAGLSLGEYTACCFSGILDIKTTLSLVKKRAKIMSDVFRDKDTKMAAVMFCDENELKDNLGHCEISNYNSYEQTIISGKAEDVAKAMLSLTKSGAKCIELNVSGAFHSSFLYEASKELNKELRKYQFNKGNIPVYFNYTGNEEHENYIELLTYQLYNPVKFIDIIQNMLKEGVGEFYTIGAGSAPKRFIKNIADTNGVKVKIEDIQTVKDIQCIAKSKKRE